MTNFADFLDVSLSRQSKSIQSYDMNQTRVWLKKASRRHSTWIYLPLRWAARLLQAEALAPVPNYGGKRAIQCEYRRITSLADLGIATPKILAVSDYGILLEDAAVQGQRVIQLDHALAKAQDSRERIQLYHNAIQAVQHIHDKKIYLSEAFIRNILVDAQHHFTFIDFETDPGEVLSLSHCQIRDWLCFIFSSAYRFELEELNEAAEIFYATLNSNKKIYREIIRIGHKLQWILHFKPEKLGNDGKRIQKCMLFLKQLEQQEPLPMI